MAKSSPEEQLRRMFLRLDTQINTNAYQALKTFGRAVIQDAARNIKKSKRIASGRLINSLVYKVTKLTKHARLLLSAPARGENGYQYSEVIRKGHINNPKPSSSVIEEWMRKKRIKPVWRERDSKGRFKSVSEDRKYRNVAFWIARKIAKEGMNNLPDDFFQEAIDKNMQILNKRLNNIFETK